LINYCIWFCGAMALIARQFKQIIITAIFLQFAAIAVSQVKSQTTHARVSRQLKNFIRLTTEAGMQFTSPEEFKEIPAANTKNFPFDYAISLPGKDFEIWFMIRPPKDYPRSETDPAANTDSSYNTMAETEVKAFTGDNNALMRVIPRDILAGYNANAGRTYLLNLQDLAVTRRYKYALLVTLEKDHTGTVLVVCLGNDKGTDFFQKINKAVTCLKFRP
jgi:hypothetical protein